MEKPEIVWGILIYEYTFLKSKWIFSLYSFSHHQISAVSSCIKLKEPMKIWAIIL